MVITFERYLYIADHLKAIRFRAMPKILFRKGPGMFESTMEEFPWQ
jgi:hypothetical protein